MTRKTREILDVVSVPKDLRHAAVDMSRQEAMYLFKEHQQLTRMLTTSKSHVRILDKKKASTALVNHIRRNIGRLRDNILSALDIWSDNFPSGQWAKSLYGIGPITAAALNVYVEMDKCPTISSLWRYAGMDPPNKRAWWEGMSKTEGFNLCLEAQEKFGEGPELEHLKWLAAKVDKSLDWFKMMTKFDEGKSSWYLCVRALRWKKYNPKFRKYCLKIANLFKAKDVPLYTDLYLDAKEIALSRGCTAGHAENRARRYALKIFLAHFWVVQYCAINDELPKGPYPLEILDGKKRIVIPNWPFDFDLTI